MTAYSTAALAHDGATGYNGETLNLLRLFGVTATDLSGTADGSLVGSPTTAAGPLMPESSGGSTLVLNGTSQYLDGGVATDLYAALNKTTGVTVCFWAKVSAASNRDVVMGFRNGNSAGWTFGFNLAANGNFSANSFGSLTNTRAAFAAYHGKIWTPGDNRFTDGAWHFYVVHNFIVDGSTATAAHDTKLYFDRILQTGAASNQDGATMTTISGGTTKFAIGGAFDTTSFDTNSYLDGSISHVAIYDGRLTQAQIDALYLAGCHSFQGVPVRHVHAVASATDCFEDTLDGTPSEQDGECTALRDQSGNANHFTAVSPNGPSFDVGTYGDAGLAFDNFYQNASGATQFMRKTSGTTCLPNHLGVIVVFRPLTSLKGGLTSYQAAGVYDNADPGVAKGVVCTYGSGNGRDQICHLSASTPRYATDSTFPMCRTLPGLVVAGFTVGADGTQASLGTPRLYMNRWKSTSSGAIADGTKRTDYRIGGPGTGTDNLCPMVLHRVIFTTPFTDTEFDTIAAAEFARFGESMNPQYHITVFGDSIGAGQAGSLCRNIFSRLPSAARRRASWCNASYSGGKLGGAASPDDMNNRGVDSAKWTDTNAACVNWAVIQAGINDAGAGDTGAQINTDYGVVRALNVTAGFDKFAVMLLPPHATQPAGADYNTLIRARIGSTVDKAITIRDLTGKLADGLHPTDAGQVQMSEDVWNDWGRFLFANAGGGMMGGGALVGFGGL